MMNNKNLILLAQRVRGFMLYAPNDVELGKSILLAVQFYEGEQERDLRQEMNIRQSMSEIEDV